MHGGQDRYRVLLSVKEEEHPVAHRLFDQRLLFARRVAK